MTEHTPMRLLKAVGITLGLSILPIVLAIALESWTKWCLSLGDPLGLIVLVGPLAIGGFIFVVALIYFALGGED